MNRMGNLPVSDVSAWHSGSPALQVPSTEAETADATSINKSIRSVMSHGDRRIIVEILGR